MSIVALTMQAHFSPFLFCCGCCFDMFSDLILLWFYDYIIWLYDSLNCRHQGHCYLLLNTLMPLLVVCCLHTCTWETGIVWGAITELKGLCPGNGLVILWFWAFKQCLHPGQQTKINHQLLLCQMLVKKHQLIVFERSVSKPLVQLQPCSRAEHKSVGYLRLLE